MITVAIENKAGEPIRVGKTIAWENLRTAIADLGRRAGLPIEVVIDQVKVGKGLRGLGEKPQTGIVICNTQHRRDYFSHVIVQKNYYGENYISLYLGGDSKLMSKLSRAEAQERVGTINLFMGDSSLHRMNNSVFAKASKSRAEGKFEGEKIYYDRLAGVIGDALAVAETMPEPRPSQRPNSQPISNNPQPRPQPSRPQPQPNPRPRANVQNDVKTVCLSSDQYHWKKGGALERIRQCTVNSSAIAGACRTFRCAHCGQKYQAKKDSGLLQICCTSCGTRIQAEC